MERPALANCTTCSMTDCVDVCLRTCVTLAAIGSDYNPESSQHPLAHQQVSVDGLVEDQLSVYLLELEEVYASSGREAAREQFVVQRRSLLEGHFGPAITDIDSELAMLALECHQYGVEDRKIYEITRPVIEAVYVDRKESTSPEVQHLIALARLELAPLWRATPVQRRLEIAKKQFQ